MHIQWPSIDQLALLHVCLLLRLFYKLHCVCYQNSRVNNNYNQLGTPNLRRVLKQILAKNNSIPLYDCNLSKDTH